MMKKTICFLFVLALIAQISARPDDKADAKDAADKDKDKVKGAAKKIEDAADKDKDDVEKAAKDAKAKLKDDKDDADADDDDDKIAEKIKAEKAHAAAEHAKKNKHGKHHKMGDMVREATEAGEGLFNMGSNMMASMLDKLPF